MKRSTAQIDLDCSKLHCATFNHYMALLETANEYAAPAIQNRMATLSHYDTDIYRLVKFIRGEITEGYLAGFDHPLIEKYT